MSHSPGILLPWRCLRGLMPYALPLALLLTLVPGSKGGEWEQGCSAVNARAVGTDEGVVLMKEDGTILSTEHFCHAGEYGDGLIRFQICGATGVNDSVYMTPEGKVALRVRAPDTGDFSEGLAPIQDEHRVWGYMDKEGRVLITPRFEVAGQFHEGLAPVEVNDEWQFIGRSGETALTPRSAGDEVTYLDGFNYGAARVLLDDLATGGSVTGLIAHSGIWVVKPSQEGVGALGDDGLAPFGSATGKIGFLNRTGHVVIPPQFTWLPLTPFSEGLGAVYIGDEGKRKAGFIDELGHWAIPPTFDGVRHFCGGLAPVKIKNRWGFVDRRGQIVIAPQYEEAQSFDAGIADVYYMDQMQKLHHWLINRQGSVLYRSSLEIK